MTGTPDPLELPSDQQPDDGSNDVDRLQDRYLAHIRRAGAASSAETYGTQLRGLRRYLAEHGVTRVPQIREEHLEGWQDALVDRGLKPASRSLAATAVRGWLNWLMERELVGWRLLRAVTAVKRPRGRARPIPKTELEQLVDHMAPARRGRSLLQLRDRAFFFYLLTTGARISEALRVGRDNYADVVVRQKGGREKRMRIPAAVVAMVDEYLAARTDSLPQLWITTPRGPVRPLSREAANRIWRRIAAELQLQRWTNHRLRDSSATLLARQRMPSHMIADHLGHADLRTVQKYIEIADEERAEVLEHMQGLFAQLEVQKPLRSGVRLRGRPDRRRG